MFDLADDLSQKAKEQIRSDYWRLEGDNDAEISPSTHFGHFPFEIWGKIVTHCEKTEIFKLLLTCSQVHAEIRMSSWWRDQVQREIGLLAEDCQARPEDWRRLYLTYLDGEIKSAPMREPKKFWQRLFPAYFAYLLRLKQVNMDWIPIDIKLEELPEDIQDQYSYASSFRCFTDRYDYASQKKIILTKTQ